MGKKNFFYGYSTYIWRFWSTFSFCTIFLGSCCSTSYCGKIRNYSFNLLFKQGFGIGGNLPIDSALFAEFVPKLYRGKMMSYMTIFWIFGSAFAAGIAWIFIPRDSCSLSRDICDPAKNYGWRYTSFICGVATLLMLLSRYFIEST